MDCWWSRPFFVGHITGRRCRWQVLYVDSLWRALACGIAGDAPVPLRSRTLRNSGRVPLSLQKNAKGGEQGAQLACGSNKCPLPSNAFSCEPRGSQLPPSRRPAPGGVPSLLSSYQTIQIHSDHNHCKSNKHRINHFAPPGFRISNAKHKMTDPDNISDKQQAAPIKKHRQ